MKDVLTAAGCMTGMIVALMGAGCGTVDGPSDGATGVPGVASAAQLAAVDGPVSANRGGASGGHVQDESKEDITVHLWKTIPVPEAFRTTEGVDAQALPYGGDIRLGDLRNKGMADFIVFRSESGGHKHGGVKPVFIGAFDQDGEVLWSDGAGGIQPARPGPVAIHDIDGDGRTEVIHFWKDPDTTAADNSLGDVSIQIRDGATGALKKEATPSDLPDVFTTQRGAGADWVHQRILICNLRGLPTPRDFVVKVVDHVFAFDQNLTLLWSYTIPFTKRPDHTSYNPAVGDIDGDGRDEVTGGRYILDDDGSVLFEDTAGNLTPNMDSVAITEWDEGKMRVLASGGGHVLDASGKPVLSLGTELVPHGQEARIARFIEGSDERQMVIRWSGHSARAMTVDVRGNILLKFHLNSSPNNTGMELVFWNGCDHAALLCNGGMLWNPVTGASWALPDLPPLQGPPRMGWYHCIPADLNGDGLEELVLYNPWDDKVLVYGAKPAPDGRITGFDAGPRQYNARLMD